MYPKIEKIAELMPECTDMIIGDGYFTSIGFEGGNWSSDGDGDCISISDDRIELTLFEKNIESVEVVDNTLVITVKRMM